YGRVIVIENDFRGAISANRPFSLPDDRTIFWEAPVVYGNTQDAGIGTGSRRRLVVEERSESFTGTVQGGDRLSQSLAQGSPYERVVTAFGTIGTLSGVTGDMTSGSSTLVVNDASDIFVGAYLRI